MKSPQNSICVCGHTKSYHRTFRVLLADCMECYGANFVHNFKLDNLRFLERCYEKETTEN